jgi:AcrR family transcriptional regulator
MPDFDSRVTNRRANVRAAARRTRQPRERDPNHPTRLLIIEAAATILKAGGVAKFHVDDVLAATGLTRGAVYHHFHNVDDLVESALLATFAEGVNANIEIVRDAISSAMSADEFRAGVLRANVVYAENERLREVRRLRAYAMASVAATDRLAEVLAQEQQRLTDAYVSLITEAQSRGWVRRSVDPQALAVFIQAYSFGVIVDDVSERHIGSEAWARMIAEFFERCVFADAEV